MLSGKSIYVFDWDGTLFDSMATKLRTFSEVLSQRLGRVVGGSRAARVAQVRARFETLTGIPRREVFAAVLEEHGLEPSALDFGEFSSALIEINKRELASAHFFPDASEFLSRAADSKVPCYVSSSVPQAELSDLVRVHVPESLVQFRAVLGSDGPFSKGTPHITRIVQDTNESLRDIVFFGDDASDVRLATQAGVDCVWVDRRGQSDGTAATLRVRHFGELFAP